MDESEDLEDVARLLDDAAAEASRFDIDIRLRASLPRLHSFAQDEIPDETPVQRAAAHAFGYRIEERQEEGKGRRLLIEPYFRSSFGEQHPPAVEDIDAQVVEIWAALADRVGAAYAQARLHHLLFVRRHGRPHEHAQAAVRAYLDAATRWHREIDAVHDYQVALRLARAIGNRDLAAAAMTGMTSAAEEALNSPEPIPGVTIRLLAPLVDERDAPADVDALLERAWTTYTDPWIRDEVANLRRRRTPAGSAREALDDAQVQLWLDAAAAADGMVRAAHLQTALQRATAIGRKDLVDRAAAALQTIVPEELGMQVISAEMAIPEQQVADLLEPITGAASWQEALIIFSRYGPITRDVETNRKQVAENAQAAPFSQSLPRQKIDGGDGLPRFRAETEDQREEMALAEIEGQLLRFWAPLLTDALIGIARKHGIPPEDELTAFLSELPLVGEGLASALARILTRFWTRDFEGAAFTAAPRLETVARKLVLATGAGIYRLQRENAPGQYPGLGALFGLLKERNLDESWFRFLHTLCANPAGWNLRNEISHGFIDNVSGPIAALLIQALLFLTTLAPTGMFDEEPDKSQAASDDDGREGEPSPDGGAGLGVNES